MEKGIITGIELEQTANLIKRKRYNRGINQETLARISGLSRSTIARIESCNLKKISAEEIETILNALNAQETRY